jgi:nicotinate-nucleotide adenylyltransferase
MLELDLLIISVSKNPFKSSSDAPDEDRASMASLLAAEINSTGSVVEVSRWELDQSGASYTIDLLRHFGSLYPGAELVLLVGEDSYRDMDRWKSSAEIPSLCKIAVFGRPGVNAAGKASGSALPQARHFVFDIPVSATSIRKLVADGQPINHLVPPTIAAYIASKGLYR